LRIGKGVALLLEVGVSSTGVTVAAGVSVAWVAGIVQNDTPMTVAMLRIHKRLLMFSSFVSTLIVIGLSGYRNSPSVFAGSLKLMSDKSFKKIIDLGGYKVLRGSTPQD
jgi:hypothetical protein